MTASKLTLAIIILSALVGLFFIDFLDFTSISDLILFYASPVIVGILWQHILNESNGSLKFFLIVLGINICVLLISFVSPVYKAVFESFSTILALWLTPILLIAIHRLFFIYAKKLNTKLSIVTFKSAISNKGLYSNIDYAYYFSEISFICIWYYIILETIN